MGRNEKENFSFSFFLSFSFLGEKWRTRNEKLGSLYKKFERVVSLKHVVMPPLLSRLYIAGSESRGFVDFEVIFPQRDINKQELSNDEIKY